jgi:hypothetical protein
MFWLILRTNNNPSPEPITKCPEVGGKYTPKDSTKIVSCVLDNCMFSASNLRNPQLLQKLASALRMRKEPPVMVGDVFLSVCCLWFYCCIQFDKPIY